MAPIIPSVVFHFTGSALKFCLLHKVVTLEMQSNIFQEELFSAHLYDVLSSFAACYKVPLLNLLQNWRDFPTHRPLF